MFVNGTTGDDILSGTSDADQIYGREGNDQLYGHAGDDYLQGDDGNDYIDAGDGNDNAQGWAGNDTVFGGLGDDFLVGGLGNDAIDGSGGFDTVAYFDATSGVNVNLAAGTATGGAGNDTIANVENIDGSPFGDTLTGDGNNNNIFGDEGNDSISGGAGDDYIDGGAGNDTIDGGSGSNDQIAFNSAFTGIVVNLQTGVVSDGQGGTDTVSNVENINGTPYADSITGNGSVNFIRPGAGNDTVVGGGARDVVSYEDSPASVSINLLTGSATGTGIGIDSLSGIQAAHGSAFNDSIVLGNTVNAYVFGRAGNDSLVGGTGDDGFIGGSGNDTMNGGAGFDNVAYDSDSYDTGPAPTGAGVTVNLITGTATDNWGNTDTFSSIEFIFGSPYADMLIGGNPANGSGATDGFEGFQGNAGSDTINGGTGFDRVQYTTSPGPINVTLGGASNGTASDGFGGTDVLISIEEVRGSDYGDTLTGSNDNLFESFEGRGGNDTISGNGGTDRVSYSTSPLGVAVNILTGTAADGYGANDTLSGIDNIRGSEFSDTLIGNNGANDIEGRAGNDWLQGGLGEDTLRGGFGNDTLDGGVTTIVSNTASSNNEYDTANFSDFTATVGITVILGVDGTAGTATSTEIGSDTLIGIERVYGTNQGDFISGTNRSLNEIIRGGLGDDTLNGSAATGTDPGFNQVDYQNATGSVAVNIATGIATGSEGNDILSNFDGILSGGGNDVLTGNAHDNFFYGGAGNDTIDGGAGNDRVSYHTAPSGVTVNLATGTSSGGGGNDVLISIENIRGSQNSDTLIGDDKSNDFQAREGNDTVSAGAGEDTVYGGLGDDSLDGGTNDPLLGSDWVAYSTASGAVQVNLLAGTVTGAEGNDSVANFEGVLGSSYADLLIGDSNDNVLRANGGDDTIDGGAGNDWVDYVSASGSVTVSLVSGTGTGADGNDVFTNIERIRGSHYDDLLTGDANDNRLRGNRGDDTLIGGAGNDGADYYNATGPVSVRLDQGTATGADGNDTLVSIENIHGSFNYGDDLRGDDGPNFIEGRGGDDNIDGGKGNDTLSGGAGNDTLEGGDGIDTAVFASNFGDNIISIAPGTDDLFVTGPEGTDRLKHIEILQFLDRNFLIEQGDEAGNELSGSDASELIRGRDGNDDVAGGGGDDALYGDEGTDTLAGGTGNDFLDGGTGTDTMTGGIGDDTYVVDTLLDVIVETSGALALLKDPLADNPGGGVDTVIASLNYTLGNFLENLTLTGAATTGTGNALANVLTGNAANNTFTGEAGNDTIEGGAGVDVADYSGSRSQYTTGVQDDTFSVAANATGEGTDALTHVERVQFADARVAIDLHGAAGTAAELVGALLGPAAVNDPALMGQYIAFMDAGLSDEEVAAAALASERFAQAAGSHRNLAFVDYVYQNVAGFAPDDATRGLLVYLLDNDYYTQASMGVLAAQHPNVLARIGFNGLAANGLAYVEQSVSVSSGGDGNDTLTGTAAPNALFGRDGNDILNGLAGNDLIVGGAGIDRAVYATVRSASPVTHNDLGLLVTSGSETDQLMQVERVGFSDIAVAYDIDGNAGTVAKIIGAMFGVAALQDEALVGQYLALLDAGTSYEATVGAAAASARFGTEAGSHSNAAFVDRVYFNIAGIHPDPAKQAQLEGYLQLPGFTQAHLGMLAAEVGYNVANVNLTGLAQSGLEYTAA